MTITKKEASPNVKAPAVYLNDKVLAEIRGVRDGKISIEELIDELKSANVPGRQSGGGCSSCGS